jgi:hypothetical protein
MPLATIHLVALHEKTTVLNYFRALSKASVEPYVVSRAVRWIIKPEKLSVSKLLDTKWDMLIIVPASQRIPEELLSKNWLKEHWSITAYATTNSI